MQLSRIAAGCTRNECAWTYVCPACRTFAFGEEPARPIHEKLPWVKTLVVFFVSFLAILQERSFVKRREPSATAGDHLDAVVCSSCFFFFCFSRSCTGGGLIRPTYSFVHICLPRASAAATRSRPVRAAQLPRGLES